MGAKPNFLGSPLAHGWVPPPAGVQAPSLSGTDANLRTLSGPAAAALQARLHFAFRYRSVAHFVNVFGTWYGPVNKAFAAQSPEEAKTLVRELADLLKSLNRSGPG